MSGGTRVRVEPSSRITRSEAIIFSELDDAVVMMDAEAGSYYELDPVGSRIWALAQSRPRVADVCAALVAEYEVAPDTCADEVRAFLEELRRREVVRVLSENGVNETADDREARSMPESAAAGPLREAGDRLAWMTPTIRVMPVARIADGQTTVFDPYAAGELPGATGYYNYTFLSS
ncbi:MAG: PqqD family protein [Acidobacteria bacterium]|nr:PqqD family protein [Acidobacteriota bacterium]